MVVIIPINPEHEPLPPSDVTEGMFAEGENGIQRVWTQGTEEPWYNSFMANEFIGCLRTAYNLHWSIELRPEVIWVCIASAVAEYTVHHSEELREQMVSFEERNELVVDTIPTDDPKMWTQWIQEFCAQIQGSAGEWCEDVVQGFSGSTMVDRCCFYGTLMKGMGNYFEYTCCMACGFKEIHMSGTPEDWQSLRDRAERVIDRVSLPGDTDIQQWKHDLLQVLDRFIEESQGQHNLEWWGDAIIPNEGSGTDTIRGWARVFNPLNSGGEFVSHHFLQTDQCLSIVNDVPFNIDDLDGERRSAVFRSGVVGFILDGDILKPVTNFAVLEMEPQEPKAFTGVRVTKDEVISILHTYIEDGKEELPPDQPFTGTAEQQRQQLRERCKRRGRHTKVQEWMESWSNSGTLEQHVLSEFHQEALHVIGQQVLSHEDGGDVELGFNSDTQELAFVDDDDLSVFFIDKYECFSKICTKLQEFTSVEHVVEEGLQCLTDARSRHAMKRFLES